MVSYETRLHLHTWEDGVEPHSRCIIRVRCHLQMGVIQAPTEFLSARTITDHTGDGGAAATHKLANKLCGSFVLLARAFLREQIRFWHSARACLIRGVLPVTHSLPTCRIGSRGLLLSNLAAMHRLSITDEISIPSILTRGPPRLNFSESQLTVVWWRGFRSTQLFLNYLVGIPGKARGKPTAYNTWSDRLVHLLFESDHKADKHVSTYIGTLS